MAPTDATEKQPVRDREEKGRPVKALFKRTSEEDFGSFKGGERVVVKHVRTTEQCKQLEKPYKTTRSMIDKVKCQELEKLPGDMDWTECNPLPG